MQKSAIRKLNKYLSKTDFKNRTEYACMMHDAFPLLSPEEKENALTDMLSHFPETIAYTMLKLSIKGIDVENFFRDEYRSSMKDFIEDVETDILIAFGDIELFHTYAKMYLAGMGKTKDILQKKISDRFIELKCEREYNDVRNKPVYN